MIAANATWVRVIDHRISAAVVFFLLFVLLNKGKHRSGYPLRAAAVFVLMAIASWALRTLSDGVFTNVYLQGMCYSVQLMVLHLLFVGGCFLCYQLKPSEALFNGLLALTAFKIAWNVFKTGASLANISQYDAPWGRYSVAGSLVSYLVYISACMLLWLICRHTMKEPPAHAPVRLMLILSAIFVPLMMVLEFCGQVFTAEADAQFLYYLCALLYTVMNFTTLLMIANLDSFRHENRTMHDFISNKMQYYEMSHEAIVGLQTKCHDLKHQIAAIRSEAGKASFDHYLTELEDSINQYSTVVECGNPTLDIVLTEKNVLCHAAGVNFTYMIDGGLFRFLSDREIYSLFGNALDNALEAVGKLDDPTGRHITLKSNTRGDLVVLQVENTFAGDLAMGEESLPATTKTGSGHGFGLRSIQRIAEKHGGMMSVRAEKGVFKLSVVMNPSA